MCMKYYKLMSCLATYDEDKQQPPDNVILEELKTLDDMIDISFATPTRL